MYRIVLVPVPVQYHSGVGVLFRLVWGDFYFTVDVPVAPSF